MSTDREHLVRLLELAHAATRHIATRTSAVQLYRDSARAAERAVPGPVGVAVAGVLAMAAERRRVSGMSGILGESHCMLALAVAVLESAPAAVATTGGAPVVLCAGAVGAVLDDDEPARWEAPPSGMAWAVPVDAPDDVRRRITIDARVPVSADRPPAGLVLDTLRTSPASTIVRRDRNVEVGHRTVVMRHRLELDGPLRPGQLRYRWVRADELASLAGPGGAG